MGGMDRKAVCAANAGDFKGAMNRKGGRWRSRRPGGSAPWRGSRLFTRHKGRADSALLRGQRQGTNKLQEIQETLASTGARYWFTRGDQHISAAELHQHQKCGSLGCQQNPWQEESSALPAACQPTHKATSTLCLREQAAGRGNTRAHAIYLPGSVGVTVFLQEPRRTAS